MLTEHLQTHASVDPNDDADLEQSWPEGLLEVGSMFPIANQGRADWTVVTLVRSACETCQKVVAGLPHVARVLPFGYELAVAVAADDDMRPIEGIPLLRLPSAERAPTPSVLLVAPDDTIRGKGPAPTAARIIEFVEEGLRHGYGPEASLPAVSARRHTDHSDHEHDHHNHAHG